MYEQSNKSLSSIGVSNGRVSGKGLMRSNSADANRTYDVLYRTDNVRTSGKGGERGREERYSVPSTPSNGARSNIVLPPGYKRSGSWPWISGQSGGEGGAIREGAERETDREKINGYHGEKEREGEREGEREEEEGENECEDEDEGEGECGSVSMSRDDDVSPSTCVTDCDRNSERNCDSNKIEGDEEEGDGEGENENENGALLTPSNSAATEINENETSVKQLLNPKGSKKTSGKQKKKSVKK